MNDMYTIGRKTLFTFFADQDIAECLRRALKIKGVYDHSSKDRVAGYYELNADTPLEKQLNELKWTEDNKFKYSIIFLLNVSDDLIDITLEAIHLMVRKNVKMPEVCNIAEKLASN